MPLYTKDAATSHCFAAALRGRCGHTRSAHRQYARSRMANVTGSAASRASNRCSSASIASGVISVAKCTRSSDGVAITAPRLSWNAPDAYILMMRLTPSGCTTTAAPYRLGIISNGGGASVVALCVLGESRSTPKAVRIAAEVRLGFTPGSPRTTSPRSRVGICILELCAAAPRFRKRAPQSRATVPRNRTAGATA
jgi:hypothetical protein